MATLAATAQDASPAGPPASSASSPEVMLDDADLDRRIDQLRKGDFTVELRDRSGSPVSAEVRYELTQHRFEFGTAISGAMAGIPFNWRDQPLGNPPRPEDVARYEHIVKSHFNAVVAENEHKWYWMEQEDGTQRDRLALALFDWAQQRGLFMRGHCVLWGVARWLPDWQKELPADRIVPRVDRRMRHVLGIFDGRITEWDLQNEMMHEDVFAQRLGWPNGARWFERAHAVAPDVRFYVNEYGVLQGDEVDRYVTHIRELLDAGAVIGGIGDQAHFFSPVPDNHALWSILDKLGQFGLPVKITEFDLHYAGMTDEEQARQLERFYRVCFAHPAVHGIYMWGFWEGKHWRPDAALWRKDWSPKPAADAYIRLLQEHWHTQGTAHTNDAGQLRFRGFHGRYRFHIDGREYLGELGPDKPQALLTLNNPP